MYCFFKGLHFQKCILWALSQMDLPIRNNGTVCVCLRVRSLRGVKAAAGGDEPPLSFHGNPPTHSVRLQGNS